MIIGIDTGGTFTDFFWIDPDSKELLQVLKAPSTPANPSEVIQKEMQRIPHDFSTIVHGTTVATNTVLERNGADVWLLTTKGFEDVIEIGRQNRNDIYDFDVDRPAPLVNRKQRIGVSERLAQGGHTIQELSLSPEIIGKLRQVDPESVAICYLFSFLNPEHEKETRRQLQDAGIDTHYSLSSEILPKYREYERFSTTVVNAYVSPVMDEYLANLQSKIDTDHLRIMQSNGGSMEAETARKNAVQTMLSGPAGGVVAAKTVAEQCSLTNVISFDMGGTSTDVSFLPGQILMTGESTLDDLPVALPMINIHTVGSGGGSIAFKDAAGVLQVGPQSAGAEPGPVCYDRGGVELTVTDANFLAGRIPQSAIFGGTIELNEEKTEHITGKFADSVGASTTQLTESILDLANAKMERAIRVISLEQGYDPGDATLIAFGGAGPLHACDIAESLGITEVLVPLHPGVFSAFGLLWADVVREQTQTMIQRSPDIYRDEVESQFSQIEEATIKDVQAQGIARNEIVCERYVEMRYKGQSYELSIPWQEDIIEAFHRRHEERYTFRHDERAVEIVNLRLRGIGQVNKPELPSKQLHNREVDLGDFPKQVGMIAGEESALPIVPRSELWPGAFGNGPVVLPEQTSTTYIPPGWEFRVDEFGYLRLKK